MKMRPYGRTRQTKKYFNLYNIIMMPVVWLDLFVEIPHYPIKDWSSYVSEVYFANYIENDMCYRTLYIEIND